MKVLVSGGGTAGHIYPALAVAAQLVAEHDDVAFVGTPLGLEAKLVAEKGIAFRALPARGFDRSRPLTLLRAAWTALSSGARAWSWLGANRPDVVIGFGAYVSLPLGVAAVVRRIPVVLHEQNAVPGLANRVLSRWAARVGVTYEESIAYLARPERAVVSGNPLRTEVLASTRAAGRERLRVPEDAPMLLVFGGSRGARHLNSALVALRDRLVEIDGLHVVHVTGPAEHEAVCGQLEEAGGDLDGRWRVLDYLDGMGDAIAAADLVVCRAGATSIAEVTALGAVSVVVPYPYATDDHQTKNAKALVNHGAAVLVRDDDLDSETFGDAIVSLLRDEVRRATMSAASAALGRPDATRRVIDLARSAARAAGVSASS